MFDIPLLLYQNCEDYLDLDTTINRNYKDDMKNIYIKEDTNLLNKLYRLENSLSSLTFLINHDSFCNITIFL